MYFTVKCISFINKNLYAFQRVWVIFIIHKFWYSMEKNRKFLTILSIVGVISLCSTDYVMSTFPLEYLWNTYRLTIIDSVKIYL